MFKGHSRAIAIAVAAGGATLASVAADGNLSVYDIIGVICAIATAVGGVYLQPPNSPIPTPPNV